MHVSLSILNNVDESRLLRFLDNSGCEYTEDESGMKVNYWISKMIEEGRLRKFDLNKFLLEELFYGMHRAIDIYKISGIRRLQNIDIWEEKLFSKFNITNIPFNNIIGTNVNRDDYEKIAAVDYVENDYGDIEKLRILFVENTGVVHSTGISYTYSYIPVEVDFKLRIISIKARPRQKIISGHKPHEFQEKIYKDLVRIMNIDINPFVEEHQQALYNMSKGILSELFSVIPGYRDIYKMEASMDYFINDVTENISLINVEENEDKTIINKGIMNIKSELNRMIQNLIVADYLFNIDEDNIWATGISAIITCIRFNDSKNNTARLNSENRSKHIFNSKAFMDLRNSLEVVKNVNSLTIAYKKTRGNMKVRIDADSEECLSILVLSHRNYDEKDFVTIWEMYNGYRNRVNRETSKLCTEEIS